MERFHVSATGHSLNYLPEYIAQRHGFFKEQGLNVTVTVPKPWDLVLDELASNAANAALGGIWVPSMYRDRVTSYTTFAQVSNRSPLALIKRGSAKGFKLSELEGRTVLMKSGNGASVGLFFKMLLRENGIDPNSVHYVQDLDGIMLGKLFQGGMGDYFFVDNVTARVMAEKNPSVSVVMEMVKDGDEIPWSVYYHQTKDMNPAVLDAQARFCAGLAKGMDWLLEHDAETFRDELAEIFPAVPVHILVDLTNAYRKNSMWTTPKVTVKGFERWQRGIVSGSLIKKPFVYDALVNSEPWEATQSAESKLARGTRVMHKD
ncbi:periplasmic binding protein-like II [Thozetella sp. PMI_491]|nr:periplasmic binding protein-like II [Thozetella sp. PMI_491]